MADSFTQTSSTSWLGRIMDSIKSVFFGLLLFAAAFILLFWNEGRAVTTAKSLAEGSAAVVGVDAAAVKPDNNGKLIHFSGQATTTETLKDPEFLVSVPALKLSRKAEMYQWVEDKKTETTKKLGGGEDTTTTYSYSQKWSDTWNDSSIFKEAGSHTNPPMTIKSDSQTASKITVGAFTLSPGLVGQIKADESLTLAADAPAPAAEGFKKNGNNFYLGANPDSPAVGDVRVSFTVVKPQDVSVIAQQTNTTLQPYQTQAGRALEMLEPGTIAAGQMFQEAQSRNANLTWILRLVGFLLMWFGLMMVLSPFKVLADVIPFFGNLVGAGIALVTICIALPLSLLTIAIAWFFFRPLLSIGLIAIGIAAGYGLWTLVKKRQPGKPAAVAV